MNLSFELQEDKGRRENNPLQPFKIVSLWEVLDFYADKFSKICRWLTTISTTVHVTSIQRISIRPMGGPPDAEILTTLRWLYDLLVDLEIQGAAASAGRLLSDLQEQAVISNSLLKHDCDELMRGIMDEFRGRLVLAVRSGHAKFYKIDGTILGKNTICDLPALEEDAIQAGNCFALGRYTACAFHLMRIMEYVVRQFAGKLHVTINDDEDTWGTILDHVWNQEINKWPKSPTKRTYTACWRSIDGLRRRRNDIMHHKEHYTEERARDLIGTVKSGIEDYLKLPNPPP